VAVTSNVGWATYLARLGRRNRSNAGGAIEAHDLRTRPASRMPFIEFQLVVPDTMSVLDSHEICDRIEGAMLKETGDATITIHVEPEHRAKRHRPPGSVFDRVNPMATLCRVYRGP
jgi:divalent metal cation (Fe/Co/Zn/Cd) transporter